MEAKKDSQEDLEKIKAQAEEYLNGWKRAKADYLNIKKETAKEKEEIAKFANAVLLLQLFPIQDNLKKALKNIPERYKGDAWVQGIMNIKKQYDDFFKDLGIEEISTNNKKFDPAFHEAIAHEKKEGIEPHTILEELKTGYKMHDRVLLPAQVKVAK